MRVRRRLIAVAASALAVVAALSLTGCAINAGSAAASDFESRFEAEAGVVEVDTLASNNLPFTGSVDATVVVADGTDDERLRELAHEVGGAIARPPAGVVLRASILRGRFEVEVVGDRAANDQRIEALQQVEASDVVSGSLFADTVALGAADPALLAETHADARAIAEALPTSAGADIRSYAPASGTAAEEIDDEVAAAGTPAADAVWSRVDRARFTAGGPPQHDLAAEFTVYDLVRASTPLTGARLEPGIVSLQTETLAERDAARALVDAMPGTADLEITVDGGNVTGETSDPPTEALVADLAAMPGVLSVAVEDDPHQGRTVGVSTDGLEAFDAVLETAGAGLPPALDWIWVRDEGGQTVSAATEDAAEAISAHGALRLAGADVVGIFDDEVDITVDDASLDAVVEELRRTRDGGMLGLSNGEGAIFVPVADTLDVAALAAENPHWEPVDRGLMERVAAAWNAG